MRIFLLIIVTVLALVLPYDSHAHANTAVLENNTIINPEFDVLEDPEGKLSLSEAIKSQSFTRANKTNFGFTTSTIWARFSYEIPAGNTSLWYLEIDYPLLDHIDVYIIDKKGAISEKKYGDTLPFNARDINHHNFLIGLKHAPGTYSCYISVRTESSLSLPLSIVSDSEVISSLNVEKTVFGIFYGALIIMLIYNLLLAISMLDVTYFWYSCFIFSLLLVSLSLNGYGFQYIWPDAPWMNEAVPLVLFLAVIFMVLFTRSFIGIKTAFPGYDRIVVTYLIIAVIGAVISCFIPYRLGIQAGAGFLIPGVLLAFISSISLLIERNRMVRYYIIAFSALFTGVVVTVLHRFGYMPNNTFTLWGFQFGGAISVALFSLGLADRVNVLTENLMELNVTLEDRVTRRTRDLSRARDDLQAAMEELEAMNDSLVSANRELEQSHEINRRDMALAATIQSAFLPVDLPPTGDYDIAFHYRPSSGVSGDFYDFYISDNVLTGMGIFDVSGHGISSALLTLIAKSIIFRNFKLHQDRELSFVIEKINNELIEEIRPVDNYITGILLRFRGDAVEYVNCGHPEMIHLKESGKAERLKIKEEWPTKGTLLGIEVLKDSCPCMTLNPKSGEVLLLYTDCLFEAASAEGKQYDILRIMSALEQAPAGTAREMLDYLLADFFGFVSNRDKLPDDLTVILLKKR
jgi:serine phosphatase RsbU (regulator of sigma subunit)